MTQVHEFGEVEYVLHYGSDQSVIEAARTSTGSGFRGWGEHDTCRHTEGGPACEMCVYKDSQLPPKALLWERHVIDRQGDEKLLKFLWTNGHVSPFEFAGLIVQIKAPMFVARQILRHWSLSVNEASARYAPLPEEDYLPTVERLMRNANGSNKQANRATGAPELTSSEAEKWRACLSGLQSDAQRIYEWGLEVGVPKELARIALTFARYTTIRLNGNLRDWAFFCQKRMTPDAQEETRDFANVIGSLIGEHFPRTWAVVKEGK